MGMSEAKELLGIFYKFPLMIKRQEPFKKKTFVDNSFIIWEFKEEFKKKEPEKNFFVV